MTAYASDNGETGMPMTADRRPVFSKSMSICATCDA